jgi:predicted  nucleic acid-binding Zn-ribbon protein
MSWLEILRSIWPVMAGITPLVLAGGFAWLRLQFPTKLDLEKLKSEREKALVDVVAKFAVEISDLRGQTTTNSDRQIASEQRLNAIEADLHRAPSRVELSKDIGKVAERVGHLEAGLEALSKQIETTNSYLHTLIEKQIK